MPEAGSDGVYRNCPLNLQATSDGDQGDMGGTPRVYATDADDQVSNACMVLFYQTHAHSLFCFYSHSTLLSIVELKESLGPISRNGL